MIEKRSHRRIDCAMKCFLYHEGSKFRGVVENLSISGAFVKIWRNLSGIIHPGDACNLLICNLAALSYSRHASQAKHIDATAIGIEFLLEKECTQQKVATEQSLDENESTVFNLEEVTDVRNQTKSKVPKVPDYTTCLRHYLFYCKSLNLYILKSSDNLLNNNGNWSPFPLFTQKGEKR